MAAPLIYCNAAVSLYLTNPTHHCKKFTTGMYRLY